MTVSRPGRARRLALPLAAFTVAATGLAAVSSGAVFTGSDVVGANTFTSGTVVLDATPEPVTWNAGNMAPGDTVYGAINVANTGSLEQRYAVSLTSTNPDAKGLAGKLTLNVVPSSICGEGMVYGGTALYDGGLGYATNVIGDAAPGAQVGDRVLAAGTNEDLCFRVYFPNGTPTVDNPYQGATTTVTLTFDAEQTRNN